MNDELLQNRWAVSIHEAGHLLTAKHFKPEKHITAQIVYSEKYGCFCGLCSNPFEDLEELHEAIFTAAGTEAQRYDRIPPTATYSPASPADPEPTTTTPTSEPTGTTDAAFVKRTRGTASDGEYLATLLGRVYPSYSDVKDWPRIHRRWRARARQILKRKLPELLQIANVIYSNSIYIHDPAASVANGANV